MRLSFFCCVKVSKNSAWWHKENLRSAGDSNGLPWKMRRVLKRQKALVSFVITIARRMPTSCQVRFLDNLAWWSERKNNETFSLPYIQQSSAARFCSMAESNRAVVGNQHLPFIKFLLREIERLLTHCLRLQDFMPGPDAHRRGEKQTYFPPSLKNKKKNMEFWSFSFPSVTLRFHCWKLDPWTCLSGRYYFQHRACFSSMGVLEKN